VTEFLANNLPKIWIASYSEASQLLTSETGDAIAHIISIGEPGTAPPAGYTQVPHRLDFGQRPETLKFAVSVDKPMRRYTQLPLLLSESDQSLMDALNQVRTTQSIASPNQQFVSVAIRLRELNIDATKGQKTSIGSLALQLYQSHYNRRPSKRLERIEPGQQFKTYHYENEAIELLDFAIMTIMKGDRH
jgi:hypothetical protein